MTGQDLISTIESLFDVVQHRTTGDEISFICPEPGCGDKTGNRSCNVNTGKTSCWRCNKGGDFVQWARRLGYDVQEGDTQVVAVDALDGLADSLEVVSTSIIPRRNRGHIIKPVKLPKGFILASDEPGSCYYRLIERMAVRKHLVMDDLVDVGVGFTRDDVKWEPFAIFPVLERDIVAYYQGRTYVDVPGESTKMFPSRNEVPDGAGNWVYNIDEARDSRASTVIVVESILNVLSLRKELRRRGIADVVPVCVFKHSVSRNQMRKLEAIKTLQEVCIMYDSDATESAHMASKYFVNRFKFSVASIPFSPDGKSMDANDDAELAVQQFESRQFYGTGLDVLEI